MGKLVFRFLRVKILIVLLFAVKLFTLSSSTSVYKEHGLVFCNNPMCKAVIGSFSRDYVLMVNLRRCRYVCRDGEVVLEERAYLWNELRSYRANYVTQGNVIVRYDEPDSIPNVLNEFILSQPLEVIELAQIDQNFDEIVMNLDCLCDEEPLDLSLNK